MDKNLQKKEAIERIKLLNLDKCVEEAFLEGEILQSVHSFLFEIEPDYTSLIRNWEETTGNVVYHVIHNFFEFGECLSLLYISQHIEEWSDDRQVLTMGYPYAYVLNLDDDSCSEYGAIGIEENMGGLLRTA